jgi:hypothetical protein
MGITSAEINRADPFGGELLTNHQQANHEKVTNAINVQNRPFIQ